MANIYFMRGIIFNYKNQYNEAIESLNKGLKLNKIYHEISGQDCEDCSLFLNINLQICVAHKNLNKKYSIKKILEKMNRIDTSSSIFDTYYHIYKALDNKVYIESAYKELHNKIKVMKKELKFKFLSYPIPKAIVEEYNKVFKNNN